MAAAPVKGRGGHRASMITILASVAAAGAWLRWAVTPAVVAYQVGRETERMCALMRETRRGHRAR
jgi:hypothetical protein